MVKAKDTVNLLTDGSNPSFFVKEWHLEKIKEWEVFIKLVPRLRYKMYTYINAKTSEILLDYLVTNSKFITYIIEFYLEQNLSLMLW